MRRAPSDKQHFKDRNRSVSIIPFFLAASVRRQSVVVTRAANLDETDRGKSRGVLMKSPSYLPRAVTRYEGRSMQILLTHLPSVCDEWRNSSEQTMGKWDDILACAPQFDTSKVPLRGKPHHPDACCDSQGLNGRVSQYDISELTV